MTTRLYPAEYVLPGHPDKLADAIADALVEAAGRLERRALVGVEVACHRSAVFITGRIACKDAETIDVDAVVRDIYRSAGYDDTWPPAPENIVIHKNLCVGPLQDGEAEFRSNSDDQNIVTGYATDLSGTNYLPPEHWLAHHLSRRFEQLRLDREDLHLGPDGKLALVLEQGTDVSRLAAFTISLQHPTNGDTIELRRVVLKGLEDELTHAAQVIPTFAPEVPKVMLINGAGNFATGGPEGDNGLSGKKLVVDAYGPRVPIGGGALSGKDFFKADRAGAIIARRLAKAVVLTGVASECIAKLAFFPGDEEARLVSLQNELGEDLSVTRWQQLLDLSLAGTGDRWTADSNLVDVARYGHFTNPDLPWEQLAFN
jgi:S-adenosylmethionine synthetase